MAQKEFKLTIKPKQNHSENAIEYKKSTILKTSITPKLILILPTDNNMTNENAGQKLNRSTPPPQNRNDGCWPTVCGTQSVRTLSYQQNVVIDGVFYFK